MYGFSWVCSSTAVRQWEGVALQKVQDVLGHPQCSLRDHHLSWSRRRGEQTLKHCTAGKARKAASGLSGKKTKESQLPGTQEKQKSPRMSTQMRCWWRGEEVGRLSPAADLHNWPRNKSQPNEHCMGTRSRNQGKAVPKIPRGSWTAIVTTM